MTSTQIGLLMIIVAIITTWAFTASHYISKIAKTANIGAQVYQEKLEEALVEHHDRCLLATYEMVGSEQDFKTYCERVNNSIQMDVDSGRTISHDVDKLLFAKELIQV